MIRKQILWLFICILTQPTQANALEENGAEILSTCMSERRAMAGDSTASVRYGLCLGYLKGVGDTLNGKNFCLPETGETAIITQRLKQVYITYALDHKDALSKPAKQTVVPAFKTAFPCN